MPAAGPTDRAVGPLSALQGDEEAYHAHLPGALPPPLRCLRCACAAQRPMRYARRAPEWRAGGDASRLRCANGLGQMGEKGDMLALASAEQRFDELLHTEIARIHDFLETKLGETETHGAAPVGPPEAPVGRVGRAAAPRVCTSENMDACRSGAGMRANMHACCSNDAQWARRNHWGPTETGAYRPPTT